MSTTSEPRRLSFPDDETRYSWLPLLLDGYLRVDEGVSEAIARAGRQGRALACAEGCGGCCRTHTTIPVYPLELVGIYWFVAEKLEEPLRRRVRERLGAGAAREECPFLVEARCAIHPMRPAACRQFNVLDTPCADGEDPYYTRRGDVIEPIRRYLDDAFFIMFPFYGIREKAERRRAVKRGAQHALAKVLRELSWVSLIERMDASERDR